MYGSCTFKDKKVMRFLIVKNWIFSLKIEKFYISLKLTDGFFLKFCGMIPDLVSSQLPHTECIELVVALLSSFWATV